MDATTRRDAAPRRRRRPRTLLTREWLVTNGLGGYASGTIAGACTRRYHGLLIAALPAPLGRIVMLNHLFEELRLADGSHVASRWRRARATARPTCRPAGAADLVRARRRPAGLALRVGDGRAREAGAPAAPAEHRARDLPRSSRRRRRCGCGCGRRCTSARTRRRSTRMAAARSTCSTALPDGYEVQRAVRAAAAAVARSTVRVRAPSSTTAAARAECSTASRRPRLRVDGELWSPATSAPTSTAERAVTLDRLDRALGHASRALDAAEALRRGGAARRRS